MNYSEFEERLGWIVNISQKRGWDIISDISIKPPATTESVKKIEKKIGKKLPFKYVELITKYSSGVTLQWQIEQEEPPSEFSEIFSGGAESLWDFDFFEEEYDQYLDWVKDWKEISMGDDDYKTQEKRVINKFPLIFCPDGDLIVFDIETTEVYYLDHEGSAMHGRRLAEDIFDFYDSWSKLGCPGPENFQLEIFYNPSKNKIDPSTPKSIRWIKWLNK